MCPERSYHLHQVHPSGPWGQPGLCKWCCEGQVSGWTLNISATRCHSSCILISISDFCPFPGLFEREPDFRPVWQKRIWGAPVHCKPHAPLRPRWLPFTFLPLWLLQHEEAHWLQRLLYRSRWEKSREILSYISPNKALLSLCPIYCSTFSRRAHFVQTTYKGFTP